MLHFDFIEVKELLFSLLTKNTLTKEEKTVLAQERLGGKVYTELPVHYRRPGDGPGIWEDRPTPILNERRRKLPSLLKWLA